MTHTTNPWMAPLQLIGREEEMSRLRHALAEATQGAGQCLMIGGEAGIGKSRLVAELRAGFEGFVLQGRCYQEDESFPFAPLVAGLRMLAGSEGVQAFFDRRASHLVRLLPELAERSPARPAVVPVDYAASQGALFEGLAGLCFDLAAWRPLLVILEDLHWGDDSTLGFFRFLTRRLGGHPLLLIGTYRPDELPARLAGLPEQLERERLAQVILPGPLGRAEVGALLQAMFDSARPISAGFLDAVVVFSDGNPFYIEELMRAMVQAGDIYMRDGVWERKPIRELRVPRSVQDAVRRRSEALGPEARRVLALAAVAGREFDFEVLAQVAGLAEPDLVAALKELIEARFIGEVSDDAFAFRHPLLREAVQGQLLARERKTLHAQVAGILDRRQEADAGSHAPELAYHYFEAGDWQQALTHARRAGEQARLLDATHEALSQFTRALTCARHLGLVPPTDLLLARAELHDRAGDFENAGADLAAALAAAEQSGDGRTRWLALVRLGFLWTSRDYSRSLAWFKAALVAADELGDPLARAETLNRIGNVYLNRDEPAHALPYHQAALAEFETAGDLPGQANTLELLAVCYYGLPDVLKGAACDERALVLARAAGDRSTLFHASIHLLLPARMVTEAGPPVDPERLIGLAEEALAMARTMGWPGGEAQALGLLGEFHGLLGQYDRALACVHASLRMAEQVDHSAGMAASERLIAWILLDLLCFDEACDRLRRAQSLAAGAGARMFGDIAALTLAQALVERRAPADLEEAEALLAGLQSGDGPLAGRSAREAQCVRAELELAQGNVDAALTILQKLIGATRNLEVQGLPGIPRLALQLGQALTAAGRFADAERALQAALAGAEAQSRRPLLWRVHAALGKLHLARRERRLAWEEFGRARALVTELAEGVADPVLREGFQRQSQTAIPAAPVPTPRRLAKQVHHGLTERERSVAGLVARGWSNHEIAEALVISERTAERHVANILAKLGLASRVQLAVWAAENLHLE